MGAAMGGCCANSRESTIELVDAAGLDYGGAALASAAEARSQLFNAWQRLLRGSTPAADPKWLLVPHSRCTAASPSGGQGLGSSSRGTPENATSPSRPSALCCLVRAEWNENRYTGLFQRADYGLVRLTLMQGEPQAASPRPAGTRGQRLWHAILGGEQQGSGPGLVQPALGLRFFRGGGAPAGDLLLAGRPEEDRGADNEARFGECLCSQMEDNNDCPHLQQHSSWPCATGISAFAATDQCGRSSKTADFPWALVLCPTGTLSQMASADPGSPLYDIYACRCPGAAFDAGWLEPLGQLVAASVFILGYEWSFDDLRFQHQRKEEDYQLRPEWLRELTPAHKRCGAAHFEALLQSRRRLQAACGNGPWVPSPLPFSRWSYELPPDTSEATSSTQAKDEIMEPARGTLASSLRLRGGRCLPAMGSPARGRRSPAGSPFRGEAGAGKRATTPRGLGRLCHVGCGGPGLRASCDDCEDEDW